MQVSLTDAKAQLTELVRRAETGEDVVLTRHGQKVARLVPMTKVIDMADREAFLLALQRSATARATPGPSAARSQDFLFDENGMPG